MKTYTTIPNNINILNLVDIFRFTCLTFEPRKDGYTDTTFKQLMLLTNAPYILIVPIDDKIKLIKLNGVRTAVAVNQKNLGGQRANY